MINILLNFGITQELLGLNDKNWAYLSTDSAQSDIPQLLTALEMLIPKPCGHQLLRIGSDNDGGYLIPDDLADIESCFSPGTANTKDFEDDLVNRYKIKSYMCDYSSDLDMLATPIIDGMQFFEKKWLDIVESDISLDINNWTRSQSTVGSDLILQMDIEGYEYKNLIHCSTETLKRFRIIVLEIHHLHLLSFSQFLNGVFLPAFKKLTSYFTCVHAHPNNACPQIDLGYNLEIPSVFELTFLRNDRVHHDSIVPVQLPHPLDRLNDISKPALDIPNWSKKFSDRNEYLNHKNTHKISLLDAKKNCIMQSITSQNAPKQSSDSNSEIDLDKAALLISVKNFPQAELYLRRYTTAGGKDPRATALHALIVHGYGLAPDFGLSEKPRSAPDKKKYILIRAWGHGFWSDVHHVIGQLFLAELIHRDPLIFWGENSLFRDAANLNAYELYFEPPAVPALPAPVSSFSLFPSKWNEFNLFGPAINLWEGPDSRMAAPYFFNRPEDILVSDFYMTVASIRPWINSTSAYYELSDDDIYSHLFEKYLHPNAHINNKVNTFFREKMSGRPWVAVHVRGSDKIHESPELHQTNLVYWGFVDRIVELNPSIGIFLLTDSINLHETYRQRYGDRLLVTTALRTGTDVGIHLQGHSGYDLGVEVIVDALLATRCNYFVGNKESNVSMAITSMKRWPDNFSFLLGQRNIRDANWFLHKDHERSAL